MKPIAMLCFACTSLFAADPVPPATTTIGVDSPAFAFSPGNWTGDAGRGGSVFRQTWNSYAYATVTWESDSSAPQAVLQLDTSMHAGIKDLPKLACRIDGVWKSRIPCAAEIPLTGLAAGKRRHEVTVLLHSTSEGIERWGTRGTSAPNILRITGLRVDAGSTPVPAVVQPRWALIIGDSITEGVGTSELSPYSYLVGRALQRRGYEFCVSACGRNGWQCKGSGNVPQYLDRWDRIDGNDHSLLDAKGRLSAHGGTGQEPSLILINFGTNDGLHHVPNGKQAILTSLGHLRGAAPEAQITLILPFGWGERYYVTETTDAVAEWKAAHPEERRLSVIDLGDAEARNLDDRRKDSLVVLPPTENRAALMGGLHPNPLGHAIFASMIIPEVILSLDR